MPDLPSNPPPSMLSSSAQSSFDASSRKSYDKTISGVFAYTNGTDVEMSLADHRLEQIKHPRTGSQSSLTNGYPANTGRSRIPSNTATLSVVTKNPTTTGYLVKPLNADSLTKPSNVNNLSDVSRPYGHLQPSPTTDNAMIQQNANSTTDTGVDGHVNSREEAHDSIPSSTIAPAGHSSSAPTVMSPLATAFDPQTRPIRAPEPPRLQQRHTLQLPQPTTEIVRASRDFSYTSGPSEEVLASSGRFSPTRDSGEGSALRRRRASLGLVRRTTRQTDSHLEEVPPDEDAARWTEAIKQKRASRRKKRDEEDDDNRVIVGKKVEEGHVNWVTAYNMLTGIRFTVSRTNAKNDRELTEADFDAKHKFSFDVTGHELTPSAKYDFKFKDYAPWVFRHLRQIFGLDPADYLMSLTSKYILSELGSPGKSGSFFYFSRDYKYIIKTIHHAEHKLLRRILKDYYHHAKTNPNTLISQFYGLHRVKVAFGRKIHFVVMNNLFPPHRDIHQTFDLKGSTIGRNFREEDLASNPRATMKDLNWLRRDLHLEFDHRTREIFVKQLQKDVMLLQNLGIMDYSLLVGIHDLEKGNEENVREKTLQVFQPGGVRDEEDLQGPLMRTPSRLENARKARALRHNLKTEKPVPMGLSSTKLLDSLRADDQRQNRIFYSEDGGIRATHEDSRPGDTVYYLGVIDCLTHYGVVKRLEHFWKGLSNNSSQISPIPPHAYGERFLNFITGITMTKEEAQRRATQESEQLVTDAYNVLHNHHNLLKTSSDGAVDGAISHSPRNDFEVEKTLEKAQKSTDRQTSEKGRQRSENEDVPDRTLMTHTTEARVSTTLPIVQEDQEGSSSRQSSRSDMKREASTVDEKQHHAELLSVDDGHLHPGAIFGSHHRHHSRLVSDEGLIDQQQDDIHEYRTPVEYTVTGGTFGEKEQWEMKAPMSSEAVTENPHRISKPPRIDSGIIPSLAPMYKDEEIGIGIAR